MPLRELSMICSGFLSAFWGKSQNEQGGKTGRKSGLCRSEGCLAATRPRAKKATPWVRCSVAVLRRNEALRRGEGTVHRGKNFWILF